MGITAKDVLMPSWWKISPDDEVEWYVRPLADIESMGMGNLVKANENDDLTISPEACRRLLTHGLAGWNNFKDSKGEVVMFSSSQKENIARLDYDTITKIATRIFRITYFTEDDLKKSQ